MRHGRNGRCLGNLLLPLIFVCKIKKHLVSILSVESYLVHHRWKASLLSTLILHCSQVCCYMIIHNRVHFVHIISFFFQLPYLRRKANMITRDMMRN